MALKTFRYTKDGEKITVAVDASDQITVYMRDLGNTPFPNSLRAVLGQHKFGSQGITYSHTPGKDSSERYRYRPIVPQRDIPAEGSTLDAIRAAMKAWGAQEDRSVTPTV
jgi:hypothetical protein